MNLFSKNAFTKKKESIADRRDLLRNFLPVFMENHGIAAFKPWQVEYLERDPVEKTGLIMPLPPGSGKTILSIWNIIEFLSEWPSKRVLYAVPLRVLAKQQTEDIRKDLESYAKVFGKSFSVATAEGPGARIDWKESNVVVATYEHASGELRKNPLIGSITYTVSLVIVDEVHEIAKDRGMMVDDILYFSALRRRQSSLVKRSSPEETFPHVLVMSGTIPLWTVERLQDAYSDVLYRGVFEVEDSTSSDVLKVWLPAATDNINALGAIISNIIQKRLDGEAVRLVVFLDTVANVEATWMCMSFLKSLKKLPRNYKVPPVQLESSPSDLRSKVNEFLKDASNSLFLKERDFNQLERSSSLQDAGIYVHHARITDDLASSWHNKVEDLLKSDFVAVFSTSTLSVGINLAPAQVAYLGKNSLWSVDQALQMVGRIGRGSRENLERAVAFIVESVKYKAPGMVSVKAPEAAFLPRLVGAIEFFNGERNIDIRIDIRGFYTPSNAAPIQLPADVPGNGVFETAVALKLISPDTGELSPLARSALVISKQDLKAIPMTMAYLAGIKKFSAVISADEERRDEFLTLATRLTLFWAFLLMRPPLKWARKEASRIIVPVTMFKEEGFKDEVLGLIGLYGETHEQYPGDIETPGSAKAEAFIAMFEIFTYSIFTSFKFFAAFEKPLQILTRVDALYNFSTNIELDLSEALSGLINLSEREHPELLLLREALSRVSFFFKNIASAIVLKKDGFSTNASFDAMHSFRVLFTKKEDLERILRYTNEYRDQILKDIAATFSSAASKTKI